MTMPDTTRTPTPREEVIVRNNGADLTLGDGTEVEAGGIAVVNVTDRVVAVERMFGRLEVSPNLSGLYPSPIWPPAGALELGTEGIDDRHGLSL